MVGAGFDNAKAMSQFREFLSWREKYHIDKVTEVELPELPQIKKFLPNGFHQTDKAGRPVWIVQLGSLKLQELLEVVKLDRLEMYFLSELELCLREKFDDCKEKFGQPVDQFVLLFDFKGIKAKDMNNKQFLGFTRTFAEIA